MIGHNVSLVRPPRYLSQADVKDPFNPFVQLVSGVVWLLRNGEVYINQSLEAECDATQTTGACCTFTSTDINHNVHRQLPGFSLWQRKSVRDEPLSQESQETIRNRKVDFQSTELVCCKVTGCHSDRDNQ